MTTTITLTKELWLKLCAERFIMRAALDKPFADEMAATCWDTNVEDLGSEALVLAEMSPGDAADEELSAWEGE